MVPWVGLQCVIVVVPDTHLLFGVALIQLLPFVTVAMTELSRFYVTLYDTAGIR